MRAVADEQVLVDVDSQLTQAIHLGHKRNWIDNHAVSDHADFAVSQDSRRNQMQHIFHAAVNDCVPGIIAALAPDNDVCPRGQHIDNLAFALIAPLHSHQNSVRHMKSKTGPPASPGEALRVGKKISQHFASKVLGLPTDNKLAASPRKKFCKLGAPYSLWAESAGRSVIQLADRGEYAPLRSCHRTACRGLPLPQVPATAGHRPEGEGLGASRPDSINVGRIGPIPSMLVPRDRGRDELLCSTGVSLFTGLAVSATVGFGTGALSTFGSRIFADCETGRLFDPSA